MLKIKFGLAAANVFIATAALGCAANSAPETAPNVNAGQTTAINNNAAVNTPIAAANQTAPTGGNSAPETPGNNSAAPTAQNHANKNSTTPAPPVPRQIGSGGSDLSLFTQARGALAADQELSGAVIIEIKEGIATLSGKVSSAAQKAKAAQLVGGVAGIKSVKNNLRVSS